MISSLWPLPMGNMESMARIPVSMGILTDCLSTMPGASFSMGRKPVERIFPFWSMGSPRAFTTLPLKSFPTGTPARLPVRTTLLPAEMPLSSPKRMQPISFFRISWTMPRTPSSKTTISPYST